MRQSIDRAFRVDVLIYHVSRLGLCSRVYAIASFMQLRIFTLRNYRKKQQR